ncbi:MAG: transcriptional repressor [Parasporobacterium sp.]|nr:transcriptional repressor [Parasporobacterium sp.]
MNKSKQRQAILDFLCTRKDHPSVEVIYNNVRDVIPDISLGTVYRNLNLLADMGTVKRIRGLDSVDHFDADIRPHQHFMCTECGRVEDIFLEDPSVVTAMEDQVRRHHDSVTGSDIYFYGRCSECLDKLPES